MKRVKVEATGPAPEAELVDLQVYFLGRRETAEGKLAHSIMPVHFTDSLIDSYEDLAQHASLFPPPKKGVRGPSIVGAVYRCKGKLGADRRIQTIQLSYDWVQGAPLLKKELRVACEARDAATAVAMRARKEYAALKRDSKLDDWMRPFKVRWTATDAIGRLALEVVILHELRRPL